MALENKVDYTVERQTIEKWFGRLTDKEWEVFASEIESAIDETLQSLSADIYDNLGHLVEQDSKFDSEEED